MLKTTKSFSSDLWALSKPYWFSEEKWSARLLLAAIIGLNLGLVYVNVLLNQWNNDFYNTLQNMDKAGFFQQILKFAVLAFIFILVAVYQLYLNQMLQIRWRRWMTTQFLHDWSQDRAYYRLQLMNTGQGNITDNPDQRIADDINSFCDTTLTLTLGLLSAVVTLLSFVTILWGLSGALSIPFNGSHINIPGYMVWVALIYAIFGSYLMHKLGKPLISLSFDQQKFEADFRFSLVRYRENAEAIALYKGEHDEINGLKHRFSFIYSNWWSIMKLTKILTSFRVGYNQIAIIFPFVVASPRFFAGTIKLGGLMQIAQAFGQVQDAASWFVNAYTQLANWRATVDRLTGFKRAIADAHLQAQNNQALVFNQTADASFSTRDLALFLPDAKVLQPALDLSFKQGEHTLITGASGVGKSTVFRALAGIWPYASGEINTPAQAKILFLPQKPYLSIGSLREQFCYPSPDKAFSDTEILKAMQDTGLEKFSERLDERQHWGQLLSGGEQQRIAIARALLQKPDWLLMDEASSAVNEEAEQALYRLIQQQLPDTTMISIGHRKSLEQYHQRIIPLTALPAYSGNANHSDSYPD